MVMTQHTTTRKMFIAPPFAPPGWGTQRPPLEPPSPPASHLSTSSERGFIFGPRGLDLVPIPLEKEDGLLELVVRRARAPVARAVRIDAQLVGDLHQLLRALVEQHLLLGVLLQVDGLRPRREVDQQVHR